MKDMKKKINQYLLTICAIFVAVVGMVFWHLQFYESAIFILLSWTALLSLYFAGEETKSVEREHTIQYLRKRNEELQETVNLNKGSMSFMTSYINELEKLIIDDDVEKPILLLRLTSPLLLPGIPLYQDTPRFPRLS